MNNAIETIVNKYKGRKAIIRLRNDGEYEVYIMNFLDAKGDYDGYEDCIKIKVYKRLNAARKFANQQTR